MACHLKNAILIIHPFHSPSGIAVASKFSSAVSQLVALYIPTSVYPAIASAASAASITGTDVASILNSALTATSTPAWLSAIPTQYSSNIASLEVKVSELRNVASVGSISGAPQVITSTDGNGGTFVTTSTPSNAGSASTAAASSTSSSEESTTILTGTRSATTPAVGGASTSSSKALAAATQAPAVAVMGVLGLLGAVAAL
jgi:hypothetical protein